jgi:hypothetical protein
MVRALRVLSFAGISLLVGILIICANASASQQPADTEGSADQGCVNQGADRRIAAPVVCGMQREFSWKSEHLPHMLQIGNRSGTSLAIAWPPYLVVNKKQHKDRWLMFRMGFRYDRTWRGYIFPTAALKTMDHPLQY